MTGKITVFLLALSMYAFGAMITSVKASELDAFIPLATTTSDAKISEAQLVKMLTEGRTCVKDGQKTYYHSKDVSKAHCRKAKALGLRTISVNNLEIGLLKKVTGLK
jgi:hypothetical protein